MYEENNMVIRPAVLEDAWQLLSIYAPYVEKTAITFEYTVPELSEFINRMQNIMHRYPYIVAQKGNNILGYAYAAPFHERAAYSWSVELSIYIRTEERGQGIGSILYQELEKILKFQNISNLYACIASPIGEDPYLTNASIRFHEKMGFSLIGKFHNCGYKFSRWYDMVWMEKEIGTHAVPQADIIPFDEIEEQFFTTGETI